VTRKGLPFEQDGSHGNEEEAKEKCPWIMQKPASWIIIKWKLGNEGRDQGRARQGRREEECKQTSGLHRWLLHRFNFNHNVYPLIQLGHQNDNNESAGTLRGINMIRSKAV
jgi:hypothetical protein